MATAEAAIKVRGVFHQFGEEDDRRFVRALADTSLDVERGELLCLIGPSGCGKSTLLNIIGGPDAPKSRPAEIAGAHGQGPAAHRDAVFLADLVAVFRAGADTIKQVSVVAEPHPRKPEFVTSAKFTSLRNQLYGLLHDEIRKAVQQLAAADAVPAGTGPA